MPVNELLDRCVRRRTVEKLRTRAQTHADRAIKSEEGVEQPKGSARARRQEQHFDEFRNGFARAMIGELAVDELTEMTGIDDERAKTLIMAARAHWFADEAQEQANEQVQEVAGR